METVEQFVFAMLMQEFGFCFVYFTLSIFLRKFEGFF